MAKIAAFVSTACLVLLLIAIVLYLRFVSPGMGNRNLDSGAVIKEVRQLNSLVTVRYSIEKVVGLQEEKSPIGAESILLLVRGKVLAGINLAELGPADVTVVNRDTVRLRLPAPRIEEAFLDEKYTQVWDRHVTWWTPWVTPDVDLEHKARLQALTDIKAAALEMGILDDARKNAETDIGKILQAFGMAKVSFAYGS